MVNYAPDLENLWHEIVETLSDSGVRPGPADPDTAILRSWYPAESLAEPFVAFWFANKCWQYPGLLPFTAVLGPERSVDVSQLWVEVEGDSPYEHDSSDPNQSDLAGGWAGTYDRRLIPVADQDGVTLVVDTRPGPMQGCISEYTGAFVDESNVQWDNAVSFLSELRSALVNDGLFAGRYQARLSEGVIRWS